MPPAAARAPRAAPALLAALVLAGAGSAVAAPEQAAAAKRLSATQRLDAEVRRAVRSAGGGASVLVRDAGRNRTLVALRDRRVRPFGSTAKLFTAAATLEAAPVLVTAALATAPIGPDGVLQGDLVLRGDGDPSFGSPAFAAGRGYPEGTSGARLADLLVALGLREVRGAVVGDEGRFDAVRGGPASGGAFDPELDGVLGGLTWNRGRAGDAGGALADPARGAAAAFDDVLEARGIVLRGVPRAGATPPGATVLARVATPAPALVPHTLRVSDDLFAEALAKGLGARAGAGTTAAGAAAVAAAARALGTAPALADGSGLSAASRGTVRDLVGLLGAARRRPWGPALLRALPVAGRSGTLRTRLTRAPAAGRCKAKTGNLGTRLAALAGTCRTRTGKTLTFAVLVEGLPLARGQAAVDAVALAMARSRA